MDAELKAKWIEALRSGKYVQAKSVLRTVDDQFCCLGVLGNICAADKWTFHQAERETDNEYWSFENEDSLLPEDFGDTIGVSYKIQETLAELNDGNARTNLKPHSFEEIADYIEKNL